MAGLLEEVIEQGPGLLRVSLPEVDGEYELTCSLILSQAVGTCLGVDSYFRVKHGEWEFETQNEQGHPFPEGDPRQLNVLVGGTDPVACEKVCCRIASMDEQSLPILQEADKLCYGSDSYDDIEILGDEVEPLVCSSFKQARLTPLRFTLPHVIKSVSKQLVLLAKSRTGKSA